MRLHIQKEIKSIIQKIEGEIRPELLETPQRVEVAYEEMLDGYDIDVKELFKIFDQKGEDQLVILKNIESWSLCEHHLLPFRIKVSIGYLPTSKVIGVSKIERLVRAYSHRLTLQERVTQQVAECLMENLQPLGAACVAEGEHFCMRLRGVKSNGSTLVTSAMLGRFREETALRAEFLSLATRDLR